MKNKKIYLIGEIGINHNGSIKLAKKLIDMAVNCGCDAVKFQKRDIKLVYSKNYLEGPRNSPWGKTQYDQKKGLEFDRKDYDAIDKHCKKRKIHWFASAWDNNSLEFLKKYKSKLNKVASPMITNTDFLNRVAKLKTKTLISTGMCQMQDIIRAVKIFRKHKCDFVLMHCVSEYPCDDNKLNLNLIKTIKNKFKCEVGYSGHEASVSPSVIALALGATYIERHITLDRAMYGSDQSASLSEQGLRNLGQIIKKYPLMIGDGIKKFLPNEKINAKKLRYW